MKLIVNLKDLALSPWTKGDRYASSDVSFGARIGLSRLGISYSEVPVGRSGCPFHNHRAEDELFFIIEGSGLYRFGTAEHAIAAGDVLGAPAGGPDTAHQIINTGRVVLRYLGLSSKADLDLVEYPDSGKFQSIATGPNDGSFRFVGRLRDAVDYWDGEAGA